MKVLLPIVLMVSLAASGCTEDAASPDRQGPVGRVVDCPSDVEVVVLPEHSCGIVDLTDGTQLFFVRVQPPNTPTRPPIVETGQDLGTATGFGGLVPIAQRTGREVIIVELPGVGHASPVLACPEVDGLSQAFAEDPRRTMQPVVDALAACRGRIDVTVDVQSSARALHALVTALELDQVVASSHGTSGQVSMAWAQAHPGDLEAMVLDSPILTEPDAVARVEDMVARLSVGCAAQAACVRRHGDLQTAWSNAEQALRVQPLVIDLSGTEVQVDDLDLRRAALWLAAGSPGPGGVPQLIAQASDRNTDGVLRDFALAELNGPPLCVGYLPKCAGAPAVAIGAALSLNCPTLMDDSFWTAPCRAWGASESTDAADPTVVDVPALVLTGRYDPFAPTESVVRAMAEVVPDASFVEDPAGGHNVLRDECMRQIRNEWLAGDPAHPPPQLPCLETRTLNFTSRF